MHFKELFQKKSTPFYLCHFFVNQILKCLQLKIFSVHFTDI
jgi:hypothetical protein